MYGMVSWPHALCSCGLLATRQSSKLRSKRTTFLTSLKTDSVYICIYHRYKYVNHKMSLLKGHAFRKSEVKVYSFIYKTIYPSLFHSFGATAQNDQSYLPFRKHVLEQPPLSTFAWTAGVDVTHVAMFTQGRQLSTVHLSRGCQNKCWPVAFGTYRIFLLYMIRTMNFLNL